MSALGFPGWGEEQVAQLIKLWNENKSHLEIARELGTTRNAVAGKVWRLRNAGVQMRGVGPRSFK